MYEIEENNRAAGRRYARGMADIRNEEMIRRQNERDENSILEEPQQNMGSSSSK